MSDISQIKLPNNDTYDIKDTGRPAIGVCETAAATAEKVITI